MAHDLLMSEVALCLPYSFMFSQGSKLRSMYFQTKESRHLELIINVCSGGWEKGYVEDIEKHHSKLPSWKVLLSHLLGVVQASSLQLSAVLGACLSI